MSLQRFTLMALVCCGLAVPASPALASTIKKCQDASGNWHYGDNAAEECAKSRITEIDQRGIKVKEREAPLTPDELKARESERSRAEEDKRHADEQARRDRLLLETYENEEGIVRARDERAKYVENSIRVNEELSKNLRNNLAQLKGQVPAGQSAPAGSKLAADITRIEAQLTRYEAASAELRKELANLRMRYDADLARYRELKQPPVR